MSDWRSWDRARLDRAYSNSGAVADAAELFDAYAAKSLAFYAAHPGRRESAYGAAQRQRYDLFPAPRAGGPTFVFVHGGYWQEQVKESFAFVGVGPLGLGMDVVLAEYTLAPEASMSGIVAEIGALLDHLAQLGRTDIVLAGHSAGGHLAAMHRSHPAVSAVLAISGLYDLAPIAAGSLNDRLSLTADEIERFSPIRHVAPGAPTVVAVGSAELPELLRHSREYARAAAAAGEPVRFTALPDANHFSVLFDLERADSALLSALQAVRAVPRVLPE